MDEENKQNNRKRLFRRCDKEGSLRNTLEKILQDRLSELEQIEFIEERTSGELQKLLALRKFLDRYLLELKDWEGARIHFNRMAQRINPDFDSIVAINEFSDLLDKHIDSANSIQNENVLSDSEYPAPIEIAESYYKETNSKYRPYSVEAIAQVMEQTKKYLEENTGLKTIHNHISSIRENSKKFKGGKDAKSNWIKFYAYKAGKYPEHDSARTQKQNQPQ